MKSFAILSIILAAAIAAPTTPALTGSLDARGAGGWNKCPANKIQPDGKLPKGAISTSALVEISKKKPNKAFPNSEWAKITPCDSCTIFNLVVDSDATQGKICSLVFDFPSYQQAPGQFFFWGEGHFKFNGYDVNAGAIPGKTTYNNQPRDGPDPPNAPSVMKPGNSYVINSAPCGIPPGIGPVTVSGSLCSDDTTLKFKQGNTKCPMGFFVILSDDPNPPSAPH